MGLLDIAGFCNVRARQIVNVLWRHSGCSEVTRSNFRGFSKMLQESLVTKVSRILFEGN